jgi:dTMP kinase
MSADRGELRPDLILFLDLPPETTVLRHGYGFERYENLAFQRRVAANYAALRI